MGEIFERAIPKVALDWTGERLTTGVSGEAGAGQIESEHFHRYFLARHLCRGLDVLDVASGEGYGSALLAQTANTVIGVDVSASAVEHASREYPLKNLSFKVGDACRLPLEDSCVDAVVSFETLEHLHEQPAFLSEIKRVLRPGGKLIISTPSSEVYSPPNSDANPFHVRELTESEFRQLLGSAFKHVTFFNQRPLVGSALVPSDIADARAMLTFEKRGTFYEMSSGLPRSPYLLAIGSDQAQPEAPASLYIDTSDVAGLLSRLALAQEAEKQTLSSANAQLEHASATIREQAARAEKAERELKDAREQSTKSALELNTALQRSVELEDQLEQLRLQHENSKHSVRQQMSLLARLKSELAEARLAAGSNNKASEVGHRLGRAFRIFHLRRKHR